MAKLLTPFLLLSSLPLEIDFGRRLRLEHLCADFCKILIPSFSHNNLLLFLFLCSVNVTVQFHYQAKWLLQVSGLSCLQMTQNTNKFLLLRVFKG